MTMKILTYLFAWINNLNIWKIPIKINRTKFHPSSFDRLIALLLHKFIPNTSGYKKWITINAKPGDVVLDIGANQGLFAIAASSAVGACGVVHAFEPDKDLASSLRKTIQKGEIKNIKIHQVALGSKSESLKLYKNPYNSGDNRLTYAISDSAKSLQSVAVERLDAIDEIQRIDLVKIDV